MARKKRYLLRDSDRSGFTYRDIELVLDNGFLVGPDEFDNPPPSNRLVPGEGDISPGDTRNFYQSYTDPTVRKVNIQYVTAAGGVSLYYSPDNSNFQITNPISGWFQIAGSNAAVAITASPQVVAAPHGSFITLECVGSNVTLRNGTGLQLFTNVFTMRSGSLLNMIYNATNSLWIETSRGDRAGLLGNF